MLIEHDNQEQRVGDWCPTQSGVKFWTLDPHPDEIFIEDIAHGLSNQCRFGGQADPFLSVAQHCWEASYQVPPELALAALLHDASEAYLPDIPAPIKPYIPQYVAYEKRLMQAIALKFGLTMAQLEHPTIKKDIDKRIVHNEKVAVMKNSLHLKWNTPGEPIPGLEIVPWWPPEAKQRFLERFYELYQGS
jgi:uncharacterized protein